MEITDEHAQLFRKWQNDWPLFAGQILKVSLDKDQEKILSAIQKERRVSVRSGTSRGKDFVAACASLCFLYLTPRFNEEGELVESTKVVNTAPTGRQIRNIMIPEISKLFKKSKILPGNLLSDGIRFQDHQDWFLTGFKASDDEIEAWSGLHAANVMVVVTEASGISDIMFDSIEGILQGNSRLVLVFNPNTTTGESYRSTKNKLYKKFRLNDLNAPNVVNYQKYLNGVIDYNIYSEKHIPGQVDYPWVRDKIDKGWATPIKKSEMVKSKHDFEFDGKYYRPNNLFRIKVLGEFGEEGDDKLIPLSWIEEAEKRWEEKMNSVDPIIKPLDLGVDIAGMGRDTSVYTYRYGSLVREIEIITNAEERETIHMENAGRVKRILDEHTRFGSFAYIDTIGEGAGVYSRLVEQGYENAISYKSSYSAEGLTDDTQEREFESLRAYAYWMLRESLNPANSFKLALPPDDVLKEELNEMNWVVRSDGKIGLEKKDDIKKRLGRSPDKADSLAQTFYPKLWLPDLSDDDGDHLTTMPSLT